MVDRSQLRRGSIHSTSSLNSRNVYLKTEPSAHELEHHKDQNAKVPLISIKKLMQRQATPRRDKRASLDNSQSSFASLRQRCAHINNSEARVTLSTSSPSLAPKNLDRRPALEDRSTSEHHHNDHKDATTKKHLVFFSATKSESTRRRYTLGHNEGNGSRTSAFNDLFSIHRSSRVHRGSTVCAVTREEKMKAIMDNGVQYEKFKLSLRAECMHHVMRAPHVLPALIEQHHKQLLELEKALEEPQRLEERKRQKAHVPSHNVGTVFAMAAGYIRGRSAPTSILSEEETKEPETPSAPVIDCSLNRVFSQHVFGWDDSTLKASAQNEGTFNRTSSFLCDANIGLRSMQGENALVEYGSSILLAKENEVSPICELEEYHYGDDEEEDYGDDDEGLFF